MEREEDEGGGGGAGEVHDEKRSQRIGSLGWVGEGWNRTQQQKSVLERGIHKLGGTIQKEVRGRWIEWRGDRP